MKNKYLIWNNPCQAIYFIMLILLGIGCANVVSASFVSAYDMFGNGLYYLWRYLLWSFIGLIGMAVVRRIGYKRFLNKRFLWVCYFAIVGLLFFVDTFGQATKGAERWIYIGSFSIQPSEPAKLLTIMLVAYYLGDLMHYQKQISFIRTSTCFKIFGAVGLICLLVVKQPDLGTAAIIAALMIGIYIVAGVSMNEVWILVAIGALSSIFLTVTSSYRWIRVKMWLNPWIAPQKEGYQMVQSQLAIGSGGFLGTNWGHGMSKFFYLPEAHTDFAFAVFCQENGFLGALVLMLLFALLTGAFCKIALRATDKRGFLLACGITFFIIGHAASNIAMVCGILPVIGVPLLFISYGGSSMVISMIAIGMLMSVYDESIRQQKIANITPEDRRNDLRMVNAGGQQQ